MPAPATIDQFLELVHKSGVVDRLAVETSVERLRTAEALPTDPKNLARLLIRDRVLSVFQAEQLLQGRWRGFTLGKYQILERLGAGGMGIVYLAEHRFMRRRVALKVLPVALAEQSWFLENFYREAQAVAGLDHPNIVRAHDIDHEGRLHFLVMEYVDGSSLQQIVTKNGPMDFHRAAHYVRQAALGLQHAHERGLVHRDIKPGNLLLDRQGTIKILDLGLASCLHQVEGNAAVYRNGQRKGEKRIVGTDDYLAPEQIVNSDDVDCRADIYSLGATFYFLLTGGPPFGEISLPHQKLIWHLTRRPRPIREQRPEAPEALDAVIAKMMAKNPWERYQLPIAVVEALAPWTQNLLPAPPTVEMPRWNVLDRPSGTLEDPLLGATGGRPSTRTSWVVRGGASDSAVNSGVLAGASGTPAQTPTAATLSTPQGGSADLGATAVPPDRMKSNPGPQPP
jgi:serine/threonine protein kinase